MIKGEVMLQALTVNILSVFFSLLVLSFYQSINTSFDIKLIQSIIFKNSLILLLIIVVSTISLYLYNSDKKYLNKNKNRFSLKIFKYISTLIYISTIIVVCDSLFIDNFLNLEFHDNEIYMYIGISLSIIAISLFISSKISLGNNYSPCYDQRIPASMTTSGLYKYIRHPIYSSNILLLIGVLLISGSYIIVINIFILSLYYIISAYREEKYLINKFSYYNIYSKKTGMFIPKYRK